MRQLAGSHNWVRGSFVNEIRGGWSNTVEKDSYTNAVAGRRPRRRRRPRRPAGRAGDRWLPAHRVRRRLVHLDRRRQAVRHPVARRAGLEHVDVAGRASHAARRASTFSTSSTATRSRSSTARSSGRYVFDGTFTGHAFADFLLGLPHFTGYILPAPDVNPFSTYYAFFVQDSWRPSPRVTIDLGLRYDLRPPMKDRSNQLGNFDRDFPGGRVIVSDEAGLALVPDFVRQSVPNTPFVTAEEAGLPKTLRRTDKNNISPRLGIAWRPDRATAAPSIRGGFGLYTVPLLGSVNYSMVATVTAAAVNFANSPASPFVFPNISSAASAEGALPPGTLDFRRANQIDMRDPRTMQWSVTVGARPRLEHRRAGQLRRVDDRRSDLESGPQSGAGEHARLRRRAQHPAVPRLERRHDARQRSAVALRRARPGAEQAVLGRPDVRCVLHAGATPVRCRRHGADGVRRRERRDDGRLCSAATRTTATSRSRAGIASSARSSTSCRSAGAAASRATSGAVSTRWSAAGTSPA